MPLLREYYMNCLLQYHIREIHVWNCCKKNCPNFFPQELYKEMRVDHDQIETFTATFRYHLETCAGPIMKTRTLDFFALFWGAVFSGSLSEACHNHLDKLCARL
jgi:hypothetical protein